MEVSTIFLFFVCQDFLYYIKLLIIKLPKHCESNNWLAI